MIVKVFITDRADGVKGHFSVSRKLPDGTLEHFNLNHYKWASCSDNILNMAQAKNLCNSLTPFNPTDEEIERVANKYADEQDCIHVDSWVDFVRELLETANP